VVLFGEPPLSGPITFRLPDGTSARLTTPPRPLPDGWWADPGAWPPDVAAWVDQQDPQVLPYILTAVWCAREGADRMTRVCGVVAGDPAQPPAVVAILERFQADLDADRIRLCAHARRLAPAGVTWFAWLPGRVRCRSCEAVAVAAIKGTREDRRCDVCGSIRTRVRGLLLPLPPVLIRGVLLPTLVTFGACQSCFRPAHA
jgi:hypothetical protein